VKFPISVEIMSQHKPKIYILKNWGVYSSSITENEYSYLGVENRDYNNIGKLECHKFEGEAYNNFHGISKIEYFFNEEFGFVEMNYLTYDDDKIHFKLEKIERVKQ